MVRLTSLIPVNPVHTTLAHADCPINGRVEPLNANDSPLILIRETHQIQTTSQVNRQAGARGVESREETTSSLFFFFFSTTWILRSKTQTWNCIYTALKASYKLWAAPCQRFSPWLKISRKHAQRNYQEEFLNVLMKYWWREMLSCLLLTSPSYPVLLSFPLHLHFPLHLSPHSVRGDGWMVAWRQKQADRLLSCMAECITSSISERLHQGFHQRQGYLVWCQGKCTQTHTHAQMNTRTHLGAKCSNTHVHFIGTYVHADMDAVKYVSRYVHTYVANTHTHTKRSQ